MLFLLLFLCFDIYCEKIAMKDGTVIYGDFEGEIDDHLIIRTKYGVLSVPRSEILDDADSINIPESVNLRISVEKSTEGYVRRFYEGGVLKGTQVLSEGGVIISSDGYIPDGVYYEYGEGGNIISERMIKNGVENGPLIEFYEDGRIKARIDYHNGKAHGKAIFYTMDSKPMLEQTYSNGVLDGFSIEYDIEGNVKAKVLYSNGKLVDSIVKVEKDVKEETKQPEGLKASSAVDKVDIKPDISTRVVKIARGKKVFVYVKNRYFGSFIYDKNYNIIDITGRIPDDIIDVSDDNKRLRFEFSSNWPISAVLIENGVEVKKLYYSEDGKAVEKK